MAYIMRGIKKAQDIECIIEKGDEVKDLNPNYKIKNIVVDIEKWIYERELAYPMIKTIDCGTGESSLGGYFRYEPVVKINNVYVPVKHGSVLVVDELDNVLEML